MSGAGIVDSKTFTIWRNAFIEVLRSKRRERGQLIGLLRRRDVVRLMTSDAAEFIAWLLEPRDKRGVRPLPRKFKFYQEIANDPFLFDALDEIHQRRVAAGGRLRDVQNHCLVKLLRRSKTVSTSFCQRNPWYAVSSWLTFEERKGHFYMSCTFDLPSTSE
jgi:hypothetical protein